MDGLCRMTKGESSEHAVLIVSEKLTDVEEDWNKVPTNHMIVVDSDLSVFLTPVDV